MNAAFMVHESRVKFLTSLAELAGFNTGVGRTWADGTRPDVVRLNNDKRWFFLGEAKNTECPSCSATQQRLRHYFRWLRAFQNQIGGSAMFAVCFGESRHQSGWVKTVLTLGAQESIHWRSFGAGEFGKDYRVVWFTTVPIGELRCNPSLGAVEGFQ